MRSLAVTLVVSAGLGWAVAAPGTGGLRASAAAPAPLPASITLRADDVRVENGGTTLVATGRVAVAYGTLRVTSDALRISRPAATATFTGHVSVTDAKGKASARVATLAMRDESRVSRVVLTGDASLETPSYALLADQIVSDRERNRLTASGHVTVFSQPDLIATGALFTYDESPQSAVVRGDGAIPATMQNRDGRIRGTWIEVSRKSGRAVVHGPVAGEIYDATFTGAEATIDLARGVAIITGHVTVVRRQGTLRADRMTVHYRTRQFVAEGATRMTLSDLDDSSSP